MIDRIRPADARIAAIAAVSMASSMTWVSSAVAQTSEPPASSAAPPSPPQEMLVLGNRERETAGSVHTIKRKQLERFRYDDPHAVLLSVPGVYTRGEDGLGLRPNVGMRGANSDRSKKITLMEDSVLFAPAPYSAPAAYYFPLLARMRAVHVLKGPAAIAYGPQTVGGAIDLLTEEIPETPTTMLDGAVGSYGYEKIHGRTGARMDRLGLLLEAIHLGSDGFKQLDGGGDTGFSRNEVMAKTSFTLPEWRHAQQELGLKFTYSDERSNETYLGLTDADFRATPYRRYLASSQDRMDWHRTSWVVTHRLTLGARHHRSQFEMTTSVYRHDLDRAWRKVNGLRGANVSDVLRDPYSPTNRVLQGVLTGEVDSPSPRDAILIGPNHRTFLSQGIQTVARSTTRGDGWENRLEYGARIHYDEISRQHTEDGFLMTGRTLQHDGRPTVTTVNNRASTVALALHLADSFTWRRLVVSPGVRVEVIRSRTENLLPNGGSATPEDAAADANSVGVAQVLLPGVGAYYGLTRELGVLAGVYRGFSPPPPGNSRVTRAEDSINWEGGLRWTGRRLRAEVIGFFNNYSNLTDVCTFSNGCVSVNLDRQFDAGAVHVYGTEAFVEGELRPTLFDLGLAVPYRLAYTWTGSRFLSSFPSADPQFGNVKEGDQLPYVPEHQLSAMLGLENKRWGASTSVTYVGRARELAGQGPLLESMSTDEYLLADVSGYLRPFPWMQLYVNVRNLTDSAYLTSRRPFGARPGSPRWLQVGIRVDL